MAFPKGNKIRVHVSRCPANGKHRFSTQAQADAAIMIPGLYSYLCECSGWHLTHLAQSKDGQSLRAPAPRPFVQPRHPEFTLGDVARIVRDNNR